jgi:uncharacterized protein
MNTGQLSSGTVQLLPVQPGERIAILDIWRGFALFGVLVVDIPGFASPYGLPGYVPPDAMLWYDSLARNVVAFLAEDKFYIMFSFLFGAGFSLQLARAEARGKDMRLFYPRRLWVLLGLGILHSVFLWTADILRIYALLGFALLAFRKRSERTVLVWAGIFLLLSFALSVLGHASRGGDTRIPGIDVVGMARAAYHSSSYIDVLIFQAISSPASWIITLVIRGPAVMALFLLGMLAGRSKLPEQLLEKRPILRRIFCLGLLAGLAGNCLLLLTSNPWLDALGAMVGALTLASAYMSGLALLSLSRKGARILEPLGKLGRMALSNYLLQSIVCTLLFDGFGFALYEKVNRAGLLGIALLIYVAQILLSILWLSRFQFGPAEWLWRSLTYRQRPAFRSGP